MSDPTLHNRMRDAILSLELAPGQPLSERGLEPQFGASRTPIRTALALLESEGLVRRDGRGWVVSPVNLDELAAVAEYREILETAIVRLVIERASDDELAAVVNGVPTLAQTDSAAEGLGTGTSFHRALAVLSANEFLVGALEGVLTRQFRTRWLEVRSADSRDRAAHEHATIARALTARDITAAVDATRAHLGGTQRRLSTSLEENRLALRARGLLLEGGHEGVSQQPAAT